jgi:hypothetical protein
MVVKEFHFSGDENFQSSDLQDAALSLGYLGFWRAAADSLRAPAQIPRSSFGNVSYGGMQASRGFLGK